MDTSAARLHNFACHKTFAPFIGRDGSLYQANRTAGDLTRMCERPRVFRKARSTIAWPRIEEPGADTAIHADAPGDILNVGTKCLAQTRDLVYEGDLHRQKRVGRVFRQFSGTARCVM